MKLKALYPNYYNTIKIKWTPPSSYEKIMEQAFEKQEDVFFYKILAAYRAHQPKLIYIGKTYAQYVKVRLKNKDHLLKRENIKKSYPNHTLSISLGKVIEHNQKTPLNSNFIDKVESLLIYAHANNSHPHLINQKSIWNHNIKRAYHIINAGFLKDKMEKEIALGVFVK